jgi:hypothetical protein
MNDKWIKLPRKRRANLDQSATKLKFDKLYKLAEFAYKSNSANKIQNVLRTIKKYRQTGLDTHGEFGPENLAFKALRTQGIIRKLYLKLDELHSKKLSLPEGASGYIPSDAEKNDSRYKTALTVDVKPDTIKKNAKAFGFKVSRAGIPPLLRK